MYKKLASFGLVLSTLITGLAMAQPDTKVRQLEERSQTQARSIQQQVEQLDKHSQANFHAWRQARRELLLLEAHNQRQSQWNANLKEQLVNFEEQIDSLEATRDGLEPLLEAMAERLISFIEQDLPFQQEVRLFQARKLQQLLPRVDVSLAEKLRQLLISYRTEVEAGRSLATSQEELDLGQGLKEYTLLRVGRLGVYYLSKDQQNAGYWNANEQAWLPLGRSERNEILRGLNLAAERGLPEFITLPLSLPLRSASPAALQEETN